MRRIVGTNPTLQSWEGGFMAKIEEKVEELGKEKI